MRPQLRTQGGRAGAAKVDCFRHGLETQGQSALAQEGDEARLGLRIPESRRDASHAMRGYQLSRSCDSFATRYLTRAVSGDMLASNRLARLPNWPFCHDPSLGRAAPTHYLRPQLGAHAPSLVPRVVTCATPAHRTSMRPDWSTRDAYAKNASMKGEMSTGPSACNAWHSFDAKYMSPRKSGGARGGGLRLRGFIGGGARFLITTPRPIQRGGLKKAPEGGRKDMHLPNWRSCQHPSQGG